MLCNIHCTRPNKIKSNQSIDELYTPPPLLNNNSSNTIVASHVNEYSAISSPKNFGINPAINSTLLCRLFLVNPAQYTQYSF